MTDAAAIAQSGPALVRRRGDCRLCGSRDLAPVLRLEPTPPANAFVREHEFGVTQQTFPLDVFFCNDCHHVQLLDVVDPSLLFANYVYVSGTSPVFVDHFRTYADEIAGRYGTDAQGFAVDIGSNDGTFLRFFKDWGYRVLGIDPASDIAVRATADGIATICDFFSPDLAADIRERHGTADIVTANNVFAHADDLGGIADGVRQLLSPNGVFVFEVSYLLDVVEKTLFDTIYHEHLAYHSLEPLIGFLARHGLKAIAAQRVESHGGSLRVIAAPTDSNRAVDRSVETLIDAERAGGLNRADTFLGFAARINQRRDELTARIRTLKSNGKRIAGFGAPAKATTLMYHFGLGPEMIEFIVDDSPLKQGRYSPGLHIPVLPSAELYERRPDATVILAWNFADPIVEKHRRYLKDGGTFIVPLPEVKVIEQ